MLDSLSSGVQGQSGGAVRVRGERTEIEGEFIDLIATTLLKHCIFLENVADTGAGLDVFYRAVAELDSSRFLENRAVRSLHTLHAILKHA